MILRRCDCGVIATNEEELELFEKDNGSKHGRRNRCKECSALKVRSEEVKNKGVVCVNCKIVYTEPLEIQEMFRQAAPTGDLVVGNVSRVCKECEIRALLANGEDLVEIDGKLIPADLNKKIKNKRISSKELEPLTVPKGLLERIKYERSS